MEDPNYCNGRNEEEDLPRKIKRNVQKDKNKGLAAWEFKNLSDKAVDIGSGISSKGLVLFFRCMVQSHSEVIGRYPTRWE